eukprot:gene6043-biopygen14864
MEHLRCILCGNQGIPRCRTLKSHGERAPVSFAHLGAGRGRGSTGGVFHVFPGDPDMLAEYCIWTAVLAGKLQLDRSSGRGTAGIKVPNLHLDVAFQRTPENSWSISGAFMWESRDSPMPNLEVARGTRSGVVCAP